jgi:hypothetical protein
MVNGMNEKVDVLARTYQGQIDPVLVTWKGKSYTVQGIERRKKITIKGRCFETITVRVFILKQVLLEFNHARKSWKLLKIAEEV